MHSKALFIFCTTIALVLALVFALMLLYNPRDTSQVQSVETITDSVEFTQSQSEEVVRKKREGDFAEALSTYQRELQTATSSSARESLLLVGSTLPYMVSGDIEDAFSSIKELKSLAADSSASPFARASSVLLIARWYALSGYDNRVFDAVFRDEPYKSLRVQNGLGGDRGDSIRKLFKYSYEISPTYSAAISTAKSHVTRLYWNQSVGYGTQQDAERLVLLVEKNLAIADDLVARGSREQPADRDVYNAYLAERAYVIAGLAHFKGEPYVRQYKQSYENVFASAQSPSELTDNALAYIRFWFAMHLVEIDNDQGSARVQLEMAAGTAQSDVVGAENSLTTQIRQLKRGIGAEELPVPLTEMLKTSSDFKAFYESVQ